MAAYRNDGPITAWPLTGGPTGKAADPNREDFRTPHGLRKSSRKPKPTARQQHDAGEPVLFADPKDAAVSETRRIDLRGAIGHYCPVLFGMRYGHATQLTSDHGMHRCLKFGLMSCLVLGLPEPLAAASFDCSKADSAVLKMICSDPELSSLDEQLAAAYKMAMGSSSDPASLRHDELNWLKARNECADITCVREMYTTRLAALAGQASPSTSSPPLADKMNSSQPPSEGEAPDSTQGADQGILEQQMGNMASNKQLLEEGQEVIVHSGKLVRSVIFSLEGKGVQFDDMSAIYQAIVSEQTPSQAVRLGPLLMAAQNSGQAPYYIGQNHEIMLVGWMNDLWIAFEPTSGNVVLLDFNSTPGPAGLVVQVLNSTESKSIGSGPYIYGFYLSGADDQNVAGGVKSSIQDALEPTVP